MAFRLCVSGSVFQVTGLAASKVAPFERADVWLFACVSPVVCFQVTGLAVSKVAAVEGANVGFCACWLHGLDVINSLMDSAKRKRL